MAWLDRALRVHGQAATASTAVLGAVALGLPAPSLHTQAIVVGIAIALLGVPHGALDHLAGRTILRDRHHSVWLPKFLLGYIGLAAAALAVYWMAPAIALAGFLVLSVHHFGEGDRHAAPGGITPAWLEVAVRGTLPIALPAALHDTEVTAAFAAVLPAHAGVQAGRFADALGAMGILAVALVPLLGWRAAPRRRTGLLLELAALMLAAIALPPLLAFGVYFCGWHAARHGLRVAAMLQPHSMRNGIRSYLLQSLPMTLVTLAGMAAALAGLRPELGFDTATLRVVFVGLLALTVPHALVVHLLADRERPDPRLPVTRRANP